MSETPCQVIEAAGQGSCAAAGVISIWPGNDQHWQLNAHSAQLLALGSLTTPAPYSTFLQCTTQTTATGGGPARARTSAPTTPTQASTTLSCISGRTSKCSCSV
jgi:hypothetical protein